MRKLFILVPSFSPAGPIKGAYALSNAFAEECEVTLVSLKRGSGAQSRLDGRVHQLCLEELAKSMFGRIYAYQQLLRDAGGRKVVASISMCFSADMVNILCRKKAVTCSSIRGNLLINYRHDFGVLGILVAIVHLFALRWFDIVVAMNNAMARQINFYAGVMPVVISNFIDETSIELWRKSSYPKGVLRFVFIGSLTERKKPIQVIRALKQIQLQGIDARADFVGSGPLRDLLISEITKLDLVGSIKLHGFLEEPFRILVNADVLVLPSLSEGISRAALEALHLGIPCVLRDVDGNSELIVEGYNGALFVDDKQLPVAMLRAAKISSAHYQCSSLLPINFRQARAARQYLELLESFNG